MLLFGILKAIASEKGKTVGRVVRVQECGSASPSSMLSVREGECTQAKVRIQKR